MNNEMNRKGGKRKRNRLDVGATDPTTQRNTKNETRDGAPDTAKGHQQTKKSGGGGSP